MTFPRGKIASSSRLRITPEFRKKWPRFGELIKEAEPCLYQVTYVEAA
jgi:hypothetical protein